MDKFFLFLEEKVSEPMARLAEQRHLRAVRDGIVATLPIIIVGSFILILAFPPLPPEWAISQWAKANIGTILLPYRMTMYIMSLYAAWGIGYSLSRSYELDGVSGGNLSVMAFLMTLMPKIAIEGFGLAIPMGFLGGGGMFVAIITSIFAVEIMRIVLKSGFKITMPEQVPSSVARSFEALTPTAAVVIIMTLITIVFGFDWHGVVAAALAPLVKTSDTWFGVMIPVFLITLFWSAGIHGVSVVGSVARPIWTILLDGNTAAHAAGEAMPYIAPEPFYQWFIWIGGAGATIGLVLLLAFAAKSKYAKSLGRTALAPGLFNINEPLIFGAPIVLNPILLIPFIIAPVVMGTIAYIATSLGLVGKVFILAPWTLPGPIGAYIATGGDWRAAVLNVILILVSVVIYYPFFKMYDKQQLELETQE